MKISTLYIQKCEVFKARTFLRQSTIKDDKGNIYNADKFLYHIDQKLLKAINVNVTAKVDDNKNDNYYFSEGFFNLKTKTLSQKKLTSKFIKVYLITRSRIQDFTAHHHSVIKKKL